jgi:hypothetical protein
MYEFMVNLITSLQTSKQAIGDVKEKKKKRMKKE